jgi:Spy/CpxP family protein refolding chaperone
MKRFNKMLVLGLCVAAMCSVAMAKDKAAKKVRKPRDVIAGEYKMMVGELKMTPQQQADMRKILTTHKEQRDALRKTNAPKIESIKKRLAEAKAAKDKAAMKQIRKEGSSLRKAEAQLNEKKKADIIALLTPEQKKQYTVYKAYRQVLRKFSKAKLTDEQKAKTKTLATEHSGNFGSDAKANRHAQKALNAKVEKLLTEEQKAAMVKKPAKKAKAPKAKKAKK